MATTSPEISTGITITFDSGFHAQILNVDWSGMERAMIDTTHMGTTVARTFKAVDLFDAGELSVELHFAAQVRPPIDNDAETCTLTFPGGTTWACTAAMSGFTFGAPLEDKMTATATLKFSGDFTIG